MSYDVIREDVPPFKKRIGDHVLGGSNNATIVLGTDRRSTASTGYGRVDHSDGGAAAGAAYIVVGRAGQEQSFEDDKSFVYLSMRSDPDDYAGSADVGDPRSDVPSAIIKSDHVRIVGRETLRVVVGKCSLTMASDGTVVIDGDVKIGRSAVDRMIRGDRFISYFKTHTHTVPGAAESLVPTIPPPDSVLSSKASVD